MREENGWHLNRNVTVGMLLMLAVNLGGSVVYFTNMSRDVRDNAEAIAFQRTQIEDMADAVSQLDDRLNDQAVVLARISVTLDNINKSLLKIEDKLETRTGAP